MGKHRNLLPDFFLQLPKRLRQTCVNTYNVYLLDTYWTLIGHLYVYSGNFIFLNTNHLTQAGKFISVLVFVLIASREEVTQIMIHSYHMGLTGKPKYAFLALDYRLYSKFPNSAKAWNTDLGSNYSLDTLSNNILEGLISVSVHRPVEDDPEYLKFQADVMRRVRLHPFNDKTINVTNVSNML